MSDQRRRRLVALALILGGAGGLALTHAGVMDGADGTLVFPAAIILGITSLFKLRPRANRKANHVR